MIKFMFSLMLIMGLAACNQTTGGSSLNTSYRVGDNVPFGQHGKTSDMPWMVVGYNKSLATDHVIQSSTPQEYGEKLNRAVTSADTGVKHYNGQPLKFRLVEVSDVAPGTQAILLKSGKYVATVPFAAGTVFEIGGDQPATAVFIVPRKAWTGKDPVVCYELMPGQGYRLTELPFKVAGKYKGREDLDCSPLGDIARIMSDPKYNRIRENAILAKR